LQRIETQGMLADAESRRQHVICWWTDRDVKGNERDAAPEGAWLFEGSEVFAVKHRPNMQIRNLWAMARQGLPARARPTKEEATKVRKILFPWK